MEKYFKHNNFRLEEYSLLNREVDVEKDYKTERGFDLAPGEKLYVSNARDGIVELDLTKGNTLADLLFDHWLPQMKLLVARTLLDANSDSGMKMNDGKIGSIIISEIDDSSLFLAYLDQGRVNRNDMKRLREESKRYIK